MKKTFAKLASFVLVIAMLLTLTACSSDKDALVGEWEADIDFGELLNDEMTASLGSDMAQYFTFPDFEITLVLKFSSDDTYSMSINEDNMFETMETFKMDMQNGLIKYMEALIASEGLDMSVEELLAASGTTIEEMMAESFSDEVIEEMMDELVSGVETKGKFTAKGGKLFMTDSASDSIDETMYDEYVLKGDTLTLVTSAEDGEFADLYPMAFKRVG